MKSQFKPLTSYIDVYVAKSAASQLSDLESLIRECNGVYGTFFILSQVEHVYRQRLSNVYILSKKYSEADLDTILSCIFDNDSDVSFKEIFSYFKNIFKPTYQYQIVSLEDIFVKRAAKIIDKQLSDASEMKRRLETFLETQQNVELIV